MLRDEWTKRVAIPYSLGLSFFSEYGKDTGVPYIESQSPIHRVLVSLLEIKVDGESIYLEVAIPYSLGLSFSPCQSRIPDFWGKVAIPYSLGLSFSLKSYQGKV